MSKLHMEMERVCQTCLMEMECTKVMVVTTVIVVVIVVVVLVVIVCGNRSVFLLVNIQHGK